MSVSTLVVGLGGTGVLTLRALKKIYHDLPKSERVAASFLAFDFDRSALLSGDPDRRMADLEEDEFYYLDPRGIQDLLRSLDRAQDGKLAWEQILQWFPDRAHVRIPASEVEANGASQLRALGRLGFFLNDEVIETTLRRKLSALGSEVDPSRLSEDKRVILVSSVAGGTGAGMMIDCAYIARRLDMRPRVFAYLLLPEVFQDVDSGGRIFQNAYGCLKELAYLKDQQIPFQADYLNVAPLDIPVAGEEPFARIFLCRGSGFMGSSAIKDATTEIAQAILGQLQRTIQEKSLAIASNSLSTDLQDEQRRRRTHCFSTVTSAYLQLKQVGDISKVVFKRLVQALRDPDYLVEIAGESLLKGLNKLSISLADGAPEEPETAEESTDSVPKGFDEAEEIALDRVVKVLSIRVARAADAASKAMIRALEDKIDSLVQKSRHNRSSAVREAAEEINRLADLVLAEFTLENYPEILKKLKDLTPFDTEDLEVKEELAVHIANLTAALGLGSALRRKMMFASLRKKQHLFWVKFDPESSDNIKTIKETIEEDQRKLERMINPTGLKRLFSLVRRPEALSVLVQNTGDHLYDALKDETYKQKIRDIFRARVSGQLAVQIQLGLEEADEELKKAQDVWTDQAFESMILEDDPPGATAIKNQAELFLQRELANLLDEVQLLIEDDDGPEVRRDKLLKLLDRKLKDNPELSGEKALLDDNREKAEERIREALVRCRQRAFERRTPNPQRKGLGLIMVPQGLVWPQGDRKALRQFIENMATQILGCRAQAEDYEGSRIWIYYEDLFNPPDHIKNIDEYFRQYKSQRFRELFHIDRRFLEYKAFQDINSQVSSIVITCGNADCRENISHLDRSETICPSCGKMIRSRCGNKDCTLDTLQTHEDRLEQLCPSCDGYNHSAWWCCNQHGKIPVDIPIDKERCPRCIEQYQADPITFPKNRISVRPDLRISLTCPHCEDIEKENPSHSPFRIPQPLLRFYQNGVNGHDRDTFFRLAEKFKLPERFRCPRCRTHLIPVHHKHLKHPCSRRV